MNHQPSLNRISRMFRRHCISFNWSGEGLFDIDLFHPSTRKRERERERERERDREKRQREREMKKKKQSEEEETRNSKKSKIAQVKTNSTIIRYDIVTDSQYERRQITTEKSGTSYIVIVCNM